jgi:hypothetical protein
MELTVQELVHRFDSGEIRLPLMQRDYVWRGKKVVRLLDSLYFRRSPVWAAQPSRHADRRTISRAVKSVHGNRI